MAIDIIFQEDFYSLVQRVEENFYIEQLNNDIELNTLVNPCVNIIKDAVYNHLTGGDNQQFTPINELEINNILKRVLVCNQFIDKVDEATSITLFSFAFRSWVDKTSAKKPFNHSNYSVQTHVLYWLDYKVAKAIVADERFSSFQILLDLIEKVEVSNQFYRYLVNSIPAEWFIKSEEEWIEVSGTLKDLSEGLSASDKEYLDTYGSIDPSILTPLKYIEQSERYADYVMLNTKYSFKSSVLLEHNIALWVKLWDNFKNPVMQDAALSFPRIYVDDFISIAKQLVIQKSFSTPLQHLVLILIKKLLDTSQKISQRLSFYINDEKISRVIETNDKAAEIISNGKKAQKLWEHIRKDLYYNIFEILKPIANRDLLEEFIFNKKHRSNLSNSFTKIYNGKGEIELLTDAYRKIFVPEEQPELYELSKYFNLEKFNFYVCSLKNIDNINQEIISELLKQLIHFTQTEEYFWDGSFNPPFWDVMKGISFLLSKYTDPVTESQKLIKEIRVTQEGWCFSPSASFYQSHVRECFFYCGLALLTEYDSAFKNGEKRTYFTSIIKIIINQYRYSIYNLEDYYLQPLTVCYCIICQVYRDLKPYFEKEAVRLIDDLHLILTLLSSSNDDIEEETRLLLNKRIKKELPFEIKKLKRNNLSDKIIFFESAVKRFALEH